MASALFTFVKCIREQEDFDICIGLLIGWDGDLDRRLPDEDASARVICDLAFGAAGDKRCDLGLLLSDWESGVADAERVKGTPALRALD